MIKRKIETVDSEVLVFNQNIFKIRVNDYRYLNNKDDIQKELETLKVGQCVLSHLDSGGYAKLIIKKIVQNRDGSTIISGKPLMDEMTYNFLKGIDKTSNISVSEWAQKYRFLGKDVGNTGGKYDIYKTPYFIEVMDSLNPDNGIEVVVLMKSAQIGGSEAGNNWIGHIIDVNPCLSILMTSTSKGAEKYSKTKLKSLFTETKRIADKVYNGHGSTITNKTFKGGALMLIGSNSGSAMRSDSARNLFLDEVDSYPLDVEGEGDPIDVIKNRVQTAGNRKKIYIVSTPTVQGYSKIEKEYNKGDQRKYHIPCRHCDHLQEMFLENLVYTPLPNNAKLCDHDSVFLQCLKCKGPIEEKYKTSFLQKGIWIPQNPNASTKVRSYHINALYCPLGWKSWGTIIDEYLASKDDEFKIKSFFNTTLGLPYREDHLRPSEKDLFNRKDDSRYAFEELTCPDDVVYINAGVDTQDDRIAYQITGYGSNEQVYVIKYDELWGDTREEQVFKDLKVALSRPIKHESGIDMYVREMSIDSGGHRQSEVYDFISKNPDFAYAIRGRADGTYGWSMRNTSEQDTDKNGNKFENSVNLYMVNTLYMKKIIYRYCARENPGEKFIYFNKDLSLEYFAMLCSEDYVTQVKNGHLKELFVKVRDRNESLDCFVYSLALARFKNFTKYSDPKEYAKVYFDNVTSVKNALNRKQESKTNDKKKPTKYQKFF